MGEGKLGLMQWEVVKGRLVVWGETKAEKGKGRGWQGVDVQAWENGKKM